MAGGEGVRTDLRLPTFLIVGAPRCGTTSLARYLGAHPDVFMAPTKEVHYFDAVTDPGLGWYAARFSGVTSELAIGEATPNYLAVEGAAERIAAALPDVAAIAILRDPVERAYSAYRHSRSIGRERRGLRTALEDELADRTERDPQGRSLPSYILEGRYGEQLSRLADLIGRERVHAAFFDDLRDRPIEVFREACTFIGVTPDPVPPIVGKVVNGHQGFRSLRLRRIVRRLPDGAASRTVGRALGALNRRTEAYPPMDERDREFLADLYRDDENVLRIWLGRDPPWSGT